MKILKYKETNEWDKFKIIQPVTNTSVGLVVGAESPCCVTEIGK